MALIRSRDSAAYVVDFPALKPVWTGEMMSCFTLCSVIRVSRRESSSFIQTFIREIGRYWSGARGAEPFFGMRNMCALPRAAGMVCSYQID